MIRRIYQLAAEGCAEFVVRVPAFEGPFLRFGRSAWSRPWIGRFYRSAAARVARRFRRRGSQFRRVRVEGVTLLLDITEFTTRTLYFGQVEYEPETARSIRDHLAPGGVFVDIGANHGYFSMLAAALVGPAGRVVAFEPNPTVFAALRTHMELNRFGDRVELEPLALGAAPADAATLYVSKDRENSGLSSLTPWQSSIDLGWLSPDYTIGVRVDTFDRWFAASGLAHVDLVKIDVEGAEEGVLAGMALALEAGLIDALICETVPGGAADLQLQRAGYRPHVLETLGPLANVLYIRA